MRPGQGILVYGKRLRRKPPMEDGWFVWDKDKYGWRFFEARPPMLKLKQKPVLN